MLGLEQAVRLPPVQHRGSVRCVEDVPGLGRPIEVFMAGYRLSSGAPRLGTPPHRLGQDTDAVLRGLGYDRAAIARLRGEGAI